MKKVAVIGHFAFGLGYLDGQTVKTKVLTRALGEHIGENEILKVDTHGWSGNPVRFAWQVCQTVTQAENVVILPAHNGLRVIVPLLCAAVGIYKRCKLHYVVVGGWLPEFLKERQLLKKQLQSFDGIYVETGTMKRALEGQGFSNVWVMPNCKELSVLSPEELVYDHQEPYKLCTFSRVMKEKGIADAVDAVKAVNEQLGRTVYELDIYGQIDPNQTEWFADLQKDFPEYVQYKGMVPFDKSVETLKDYFALLFPTRFYTEGVPGTIIDAYAAGVPVISAKWESFADVIDDMCTGYGYEFGNTEELQELLIEIASEPEMITNLKENCLIKAREYTPEKAIDVLLKKMKG